MIQFNKKRGLCGNASTMYKDNATIECDVLVEMRMQFERAGLDPRYPFGEHEYLHRKNYRSMHECPKRLQWVYKRCTIPAPNQSPELTEFYKAWYLWAIAQSN